MFDPGLADVRRFFCEVWRKHGERVPLSPIEAVALDWILRHPEYQAELADPEAALAADYSPERGRTNPFLHLSLHLAIAEQLQSPWLIANLSSIRRKLAASFSPALRDRIDGLRNRILVGKHASAAMLQGFRGSEAVGVDGLLQAFLELRCLRIGYEDAQARRTLRTVEPQMLLLNYPIWYLIGWDHARNAVRSFRCDRIVSSKQRLEHVATVVDGCGVEPVSKAGDVRLAGPPGKHEQPSIDIGEDGRTPDQRERGTSQRIGQRARTIRLPAA